MPTGKVNHQILETYKKIFDSFKTVNSNRFPEIRNYLQAYIDQNSNSDEPAKKKKVAAVIAAVTVAETPSHRVTYLEKAIKLTEG